jgi:hypothetical protein
MRVMFASLLKFEFVLQGLAESFKKYSQSPSTSY